MNLPTNIEKLDWKRFACIVHKSLAKVTFGKAVKNYFLVVNSIDQSRFAAIVLKTFLDTCRVSAT